MAKAKIPSSGAFKVALDEAERQLIELNLKIIQLEDERDSLLELFDTLKEFV